MPIPVSRWVRCVEITYHHTARTVAATSAALVVLQVMHRVL